MSCIALVRDGSGLGIRLASLSRTSPHSSDPLDLCLIDELIEA